LQSTRSHVLKIARSFLFPLSLTLLALAQLNAQIHYDPNPAAVVDLADGKLQGAEPATGVRAYLGIPYAKPPIGALRWQPPQPFGPLSADRSNPRSAVAHGTPCPQQRFGWNNGSADHGVEDCLFLNVWAPAHGSHLPVMVYIHGGSNTAGSASEELSNGLALVPRGVVLVTFDYRLGIFGFFRTPELDAQSGYRGSGNYGLMDQIAVLRWVHDNIRAFGGDPAKVTIFGQSAGAVDTGLLMASPLARGLFAGALEESGQVLGLMPTASRQQSEDAWAPVAKALGADLAVMRRATTAEVLAAEHDAPKPPPENFWGYRGASVDGHVLPDLPAHIFAQGHEAPVPLLLGSNVQEIVPHGQTTDQTNHLIAYAVGAQRADALEAIYAQPPANPLEGDAGARFQTDRDFRCPVLQIATWHASHSYSTYVYQFDRSEGSATPAQHSSELRFVFGFPAAHIQPGAINVSHSAHGPTEEDLKVSATIQTYWTNFAHNGSPTPAAGLAEWPRFQLNAPEYLHFIAGLPTPEIADTLGGASCVLLGSSDLPGSR
jgi:para-nitrobenzyl esterase